jgi:phage-related baseplate assembly protein
VEDAEVVSYDIDFTYYIQTGSAASAADIAAAVQMAVDEFNAWQCARLGRDINPSHLIGELMKTGVKRVELTAPVFTKLHDGSDKTVPQVASFGTAAIVNGGYEDE